MVTKKAADKNIYYFGMYEEPGLVVNVRTGDVWKWDNEKDKLEKHGLDLAHITRNGFFKWGRALTAVEVEEFKHDKKLWDAKNKDAEDDEEVVAKSATRNSISKSEFYRKYFK